MKKGKKQTNKKTMRSLCLRLKTEEEIKILEDFRNVATFYKRGVRDVVFELMSLYVGSNYPSRITLATEKQILQLSKQLDAPTSYPTLRKWRLIGALKDSGGNFWFRGPEGAIVYNLDKMEEFLLRRKEHPYARLIPKKKIGETNELTNDAGRV